MEQIDALVLSKYQKISDWFQTWFGKDNFNLARLFLLIYVIGCLGEIHINQLMGHQVSMSMSIFFPSIIVVSFLIQIRSAEMLSRSNPTFSNIYAQQYKFLRPLFLCYEMIMLPLVILHLFGFEQMDVLSQKDKMFDIAHLTHSVGFFSTWYFLCCTPKPKKPSKLKQKFEQLKESISNFGLNQQLHPG